MKNIFFSIFLIFLLGTFTTITPSESKYSRDIISGTFISGEKKIIISKSGINDGGDIGTYEIIDNEIAAKILLYTLIFRIDNKDQITCIMSPSDSLTGRVFKRAK